MSKSKAKTEAPQPEVSAPAAAQPATPAPSTIEVAPAESVESYEASEAIAALRKQEVMVTRDTPQRWGLTHRYSCMNRMGPAEPFFVLRAQDLLADHLVEEWARHAELHGCDPRKVQEARDTAREMRGWQKRKYPD